MNITQKKIGFVSLGCDKNRVDLERIIYLIKQAGFEITNNINNANVIIINTCAFIEIARKESVETILEISQLKNANLEKIIVTGCLNELNITDLSESLPEVDRFINIKNNKDIVNVIFDLYNLPSFNIVNLNNFEQSPRTLSTPSHFAYLKISEGCDNFCSYCQIPFIRGRYKSESIENLVNEAKNLVDSGVKELILIAQDVTKYGIDLYGKIKLVPLIQKLSAITNLKWIRLLYCYPENITDELIKEIETNEKVCKYIDIPLQHVSDKILKLMNRKSNFQSIVATINKLRKHVKDINIRSTFIIGFPNETEEDFNALCDFIKFYKLNQVGFFTYSKEQGTMAATLKNQVLSTIKKQRLKVIANMQFEIVQKLNQSLVGKKLDVLVDRVYKNTAYCRACFQSPFVDSNIIIKNAKNLLVGNFYSVKIVRTNKYDLIGEIL